MTSTDQAAVHDTLARMDEGWSRFRERFHALPGEHIEAHIGDGGWTRKQMLAHVATWHDLTVDRLLRFQESGEPSELDEETDAINARSARTAVGRTSGEILLAVDDSYRRLRREVARLSDAQLSAHGDWAAAIIAGNTYDHYTEHLADLKT